MPQEFICEEIKVELADKNPLEPIGFEWREKKYSIEKVKGAWQDWSLGSGKATVGMAWRQRRHRNYFRVITTTNEEFEIYYDRGGKNPCWILANRIA